ncbi:protein IQ-DOMAIN 14-like [Phyllostomus discolor]|uniref:Protein IQ-DOMAIN 14-like n=1 Tax=Phyllostomus discolor TaxID=89673 RepID=A0A7E6EG80_9CHIR|nr:protein IQ-DOMAIN 14-like [Phyllostomus discolor]
MSRRTSTTRDYKSRGASRAAGGERALARRSRTGPRACPRALGRRKAGVAGEEEQQRPQLRVTEALPCTPSFRGQRAGTLAVDCVLPGPPSVTVSSHGHRRLAPPQDLGPGHLPRPRPLCPLGSPAPLADRAAAVRGADPEQAPLSGVPSLVPRGCEGRLAHTHTAQPRSSAALGRRRVRRPRPPIAVFTSARLELPRAPPPRLQGNRGFRLLLWEPEVTVYSHGRPAARPRAAPRRSVPTQCWIPIGDYLRLVLKRGSESGGPIVPVKCEQ